MDFFCEGLKLDSSTDLINSTAGVSSNKMQDWYTVKLLQAADLGYMSWEEKPKHLRNLIRQLDNI